MKKPTICIGENKGADQLISAFVFATRIVQFLFYLNPKFQASSSCLCLYSSVCVGPVRKPHSWFSHEVAHINLIREQSILPLKTYMNHNLSNIVVLAIEITKTCPCNIQRFF